MSGSDSAAGPTIDAQVRVEPCPSYDIDALRRALEAFAPLLDRTIQPGQTVALKPNWLASGHRDDPNTWECVITHPNFITAVIEMVASRLRGSGRIILADAPQTSTLFARLQTRFRLDDWQYAARSGGAELEVLDLRDHEFHVVDGVVLGRRDLPGDPRGSVEFDLGEASEFVGHKRSERGYYGADYDTVETNRVHSNGTHRYRLSRSVIEADVFINLPKWKTHKKAGLTCSLKNLVGINTYKNFLPHHSEGTPSMGGDQFPDDRTAHALETHLLASFKGALLRAERFNRLMLPVKRLGKLLFGPTGRRVRNGNWYGNDTIWRMILDLNKCLLYGNPDGTLRPAALKTRKPYLSLVDGIIAGEGDGPEAPSPIETGVLFGGRHPLAVDCAAAWLMGFDYRKIPSLSKAFEIRAFPFADFTHGDLRLESHGRPDWNGPVEALPASARFSFRPHFGWRGGVELDETLAA